MRRVALIFTIMSSLFATLVSHANSNDIPQGQYQVDVALWHAYEDKSSMGNEGMETKANLVVDDEGMNIYLGMKLLTFGKLTTSVSRFFYADEVNKVYKSANTYAYDIEVPNDSVKRPRIYSFSLSEKQDFYKVMVDPKVAEMGKDPIKARLKIDWSTLKQVSEEEMKLVNDAKSDKNKKELPTQIVSQGVRISDSAGVSGEVSVNPVSRATLEGSGLKIEKLDQVKGYSIIGTENIEEIPFDSSSPSENSKQLQLGSEANIVFENEKEATSVYLKENEGFKKVDFEKTDEGILIKNAKYGIYAVVKSAKANLNESQNNEQNADPGKVDITGEVSNAASKENPNKNPFVSATKPRPKKVNQVGSVNNSNEKNNKTADINKNNNIKNQVTTNSEENLNVALDSNSMNSEQNKIKQAEPKEHKGIIITVSVFYVSLFVGGYLFHRKFLPLLLSEIGRSRHLVIYAIKGEQSDEK